MALGDDMRNDMDREFENGPGRVFAVYRQLTQAPEASSTFGPDVWKRIEAGRRARLFGLWAKVLSASALTASLVLGVMPSKSTVTPEPEYLTAYLEGTPSLSADAELGYSLSEAALR